MNARMLATGGEHPVRMAPGAFYGFVEIYLDAPYPPAVLWDEVPAAGPAANDD